MAAIGTPYDDDLDDDDHDDDDDDDEPFGTTPIPTSLPDDRGIDAPVSVTLDMDPILGGSGIGGLGGINGGINGGNGIGIVAQQPQTTQIAVYEATPNEACINGSLVDVNQHFVVYAVKNGLIRVMHRHSAMRTLLRGHTRQSVTDLRFFLDGDVLGTVGSGGGVGTDLTSTLIVWRVFERSPEIMSEKLLEISTHSGMAAPDLTMSRLVWHPFNPNQFWMMHSTRTTQASSHSALLLQVATLVETTRIQTRPHPDEGETHALCLWHSPYCVMDGALQLIEGGGNLTDLAWSGRDARHVLTVHDNGSIILWDLKDKEADAAGAGAGDNDVTVPKRLLVLREGSGIPHSRCCFLPHDHSVRQDEELQQGQAGGIAALTTCFVTASHRNTVVTLWSAFMSLGGGTSQGGVHPPTKLQQVNLAAPHPTGGTVITPSSSFVMNVCYGPAPPNAAPPSCFILLGSRQAGRLLALHVRSVWGRNNQQQQQQQQLLLQKEQPSPPPPRAMCVGVDYVVPFALKHPVYSWSVMCCPTQDIAEEEIQERAGLIFDMKAFAYQSKLVQCLTLTSYMCLPPEHGYKSGRSVVQVAPLTGKYVDYAPGSEATTPGADYDEDYDIDDEELDDEDDDDDDDDDEYNNEAPAAKAASAGPGPATAPSTVLPLPFGGGGNPFANWLGAIAGSSSSAGPFATGNAGVVPPPPPPPTTPATGLAGVPVPPPGLAPSVPPAAVPNGPPSFLSPMDLFKNTTGSGSSAIKQDPTQAATGKDKKKKGRNNSPKRSSSPKGGKKQGNDSSKTPFPDGKVAILKRDVIAPPQASAVVLPPPPIPNDPSVVSDPAILAAAGIPVLDHFTAALPPPPLPPPPQFPSSPVATLDPVLLGEQVSQAVEHAVATTVVPAVNKAVQESFGNLARPLLLSMDRLSSQGVTVDPNELQKAWNVETPLRAALAETMRHSMVPALESITSQLLQQVQTSMPPPPPDQSKALEAVVQQLAAMNAKMETLTREVQVLRTAVADQTAASVSIHGSSRGTSEPPPPQAPAPAQPPAMLKLEQTRNEITHLLSKEQYEAAFTKAVSASTADMAVFACSRADLSKVLGGAAPTLSQPILLCLMQQLGAALPTTTSPDHLSTEVSWLQEIALTLNPAEASIQRHVPTVLQQLVGSINAKMAGEGDGQVRRKLQMLLQVLRGIQLG